MKAVLSCISVPNLRPKRTHWIIHVSFICFLGSRCSNNMYINFGGWPFSIMAVHLHKPISKFCRNRLSCKYVRDKFYGIRRCVLLYLFVSINVLEFISKIVITFKQSLIQNGTKFLLQERLRLVIYYWKAARFSDGFMFFFLMSCN